MGQEAVIIGVVIFGLLHGANPSHGWTVAALYSIRSRRLVLGAIVSSGMIASAHFLSSIIVVIAAYLFWREKGEDLIETQHGHPHSHP
jgi:nickel/cobalt exporter